jgi:hypothetical protein
MKKARNLFVRISGGLAISVALFAAVPANAAHELMYAIEVSSDNLLSFYSDAPGTILSSYGITGIQGGEQIRGLDIGPGGVLYGLGSSSRLYTINPTTGAATAVGSGLGVILNGSTFGFDVGTAGTARSVSSLGQNLSITLGTGAGVLGTSVAYTAGDPHFGQTPRVDALAFNGATWLAGDSLANSFASFNPATGALTTIGNAGIDFAPNNGLDFSSISGLTYLASPAASSDPAANLYTVNTGSGAVTLVGLIGLPGDNILVRGLTVVPEPSALGMLALGGLIFAFLRRRQ